MPFFLVPYALFIVNSLTAVGVFLFKMMVGSVIFVAIYAFLTSFIVPYIDNFVQQFLSQLGAFSSFSTPINQLFSFLEVYKLFSAITACIMACVFFKIAMMSMKAYTTPNPIGKLKA